MCRVGHRQGSPGVPTAFQLTSDDLGAMAMEADSTAEACERVARLRDPYLAALAHERAAQVFGLKLLQDDVGEDLRRRMGMSRRSFVRSAAAYGIGLWAIGQVMPSTFGSYAAAAPPGTGACELEWPGAQLANLPGEFIFDVQGHYVDPTEAWLKVAPETAFDWSPKAGCALADGKTPRSHLACLTSEEFVKDVFLDSDTDMMVLSFVPSRRLPKNFPTCASSSRGHRAGSPTRSSAPPRRSASASSVQAL